MTNNYTIEQYTPGHREICVELFRKVYGSPPFEFEWLDAAKTSEYFSDLESIPHSLGYVLSDGGSVVGACMGQKEFHNQNPGYKINEFFIEPEHQHLGLGTYFINELENRLRELDLKIIYLFTQRNMGSYFFYKRNGFFSNDKTVHMARVIQQEPTVVYTRTFLNSDNNPEN